MESKPSPPEVDRYASEGPGTTTARRWAKDAIDALLLDDPNLDVDPERAAKRSRDALRRVFAMPGSRAGSRAGTSGGRFSATFSKEKVPRSIGATNCGKQTHIPTRMTVLMNAFSALGFASRETHACCLLYKQKRQPTTWRS